MAYSQTNWESNYYICRVFPSIFHICRPALHICLSVCLSARKPRLSIEDFCKILHLQIVLKTADKNQIWMKY
jgi:hypothetical protein